MARFHIFFMLATVMSNSGAQTMAGHKGHEFVWVKNVDHQLRHEADSDELRAVAEESAEGLREHFYWQKSRKPEAGQR